MLRGKLIFPVKMSAHAHIRELFSHSLSLFASFSLSLVTIDSQQMAVEQLAVSSYQCS